MLRFEQENIDRDYVIKEKKEELIEEKEKTSRKIKKIFIKDLSKE